VFYEPSKGHGLPNNPLNALVVPRDIDEFENVGLTKSKAVVVNAPRVAESPAHLECRTTQVLELPSDDSDDRNVMVLGEVVAVHIDDAFLIDGRVA
jgi:flavin reductase (DIM6/NTAB) family NADH-FMN oxidoreductase RutF